jgi:hypothetical protein
MQTYRLESRPTVELPAADRAGPRPGSRPAAHGRPIRRRQPGVHRRSTGQYRPGVHRTAHQRRPEHRPWRAAWTAVFAVLLGAAAGPLSWYAHDHLSGAARLASDSAAAWLAVAFVAGLVARSRHGGAVAGFAALSLAVLTYYATQEAYGEWAEADRAVDYWQSLAAVTGPAFGALGAAARTADPMVRGLAAAAMSAACCAEAVIGYESALTDGMRHLYAWEGLLGLLALAVLSRGWRSLGAGLCWLVVLGAVGIPVMAALLHAQHDRSLPALGNLPLAG